MRMPVVTKAILALVSVLSVACELFRVWGMVERVVQVAEGETDKRPVPNVDAYLIMLILRKTPWWAFWTLVTTGFVETQIVPFLVFVVVAATGGRYCEQVWGSHAYLQFAVTMLVATTFAETLIWGWFASAPTPVCGANGLLAGIVVALKQLAPGHTIILLRSKVRIQIKWLPLIFLVFVTVLQVLGLEENVLAYYLGFLGGWVVLRFFQRLDGTTEGDASDAFSFANFFPQPVSGWLEVPLDNLYRLFSSKLSLVRNFTPENIDEANQKYAARLSGTLLPTFKRGARTTNERRKMMLSAMDKEL